MVLKKTVKFAHFVLTPVKVLLCSARDFYENTLCDCAGRICEESVVMTSYVILPQVYPMPGYHSSSSSRTSTKEKRSIESSTEHIKVITTRNAKENMSETKGGGRGKSSGSYLRSYSIGVRQIGRIDEDAPCDFVATNGSNKMYPRCRNCAFQ